MGIIKKRILVMQRGYQEPNPGRFGMYEEDNTGKGFYLPTGEYFKFDHLHGWFDEFGNYYDMNGIPTQCPYNPQQYNNQNKNQYNNMNNYNNNFNNYGNKGYNNQKNNNYHNNNQNRNNNYNNNYNNNNNNKYNN